MQYGEECWGGALWGTGTEEQGRKSREIYELNLIHSNERKVFGPDCARLCWTDYTTLPRRSNKLQSRAFSGTFPSLFYKI